MAAENDLDAQKQRYTVCVIDEKKGNPMSIDDATNAVFCEMADDAISTTNTEHVLLEEKSCLMDKMDRSFFGEKLTYVFFVAIILVIACSITSSPWVLPFVYLCLIAVFIPFRIWKYLQVKYQYYLLDWCYFSNALLIIYLIAVPWSGSFYVILFGLSNGPVAWAVLTFRNCLVLHSVERMTSLTIHMMPQLITYAIRWHGPETSLSWYQDFSISPGEVPVDDVHPGVEMLWLIAVPVGIYMLHAVLYLVLTNVILRPSKEYSNIYRYLVHESDGAVSKITGCCGPKCKVFIFLLLNFTYTLLTLLLTWVSFHFRIAHTAHICLMIGVAAYNGATYYMDLFVRKGLAADPYRVCGRD